MTKVTETGKVKFGSAALALLCQSAICMQFLSVIDYESYYPFLGMTFACVHMGLQYTTYPYYHVWGYWGEGLYGAVFGLCAGTLLLYFYFKFCSF